MTLVERAKQSLELVKNYFKEGYPSEEVCYYAFVISLLPVPGLQQGGRILDRIISNKSLKTKLDEVWEEIKNINGQISTVTTEIEKFNEIVGTINRTQAVSEKLKEITSSIVADLKQNTEWIIETENWSYQEVLNSFVEADSAQIIARNNSTNTIENSEIKAKKTHLHASDHSKNFVDNTKFTGQAGGVEMRGISTEGNIFVEGSGIGFGPNSSIIFGGNPNLVKGNCPFCGTHIEVDKRKLVGFSKIQCPSCKKEMPFNLP